MERFRGPLNTGRFYIVVIWLFLFWLVIEANLFRLQIVQHQRFADLAKKQYDGRVILKAQRGTIFDNSGNKLATNIIYYDVAADPIMLKNKNYVAKTLAAAFHKSAHTYLKKLHRQSHFAYLERKVPRDKIKGLLNFRDPGLILIESFGRYYPYDGYAAQLLGFTDPDDRGLGGLELQYESSLAGIDGEAMLQFDAVRRASYNPDYPMQKPVPGQDMYLTIDKDIQTVVEKALAAGVEKSKARSGMAVVMDPFSGAVLAMANYPGFDANVHKNYPEWQKRNRAITDVFEPGSVMKLFTSAALLQERIHKPNDIVFCENGSYKVYNRVYHDTKAHGWLSFEKVVEKSSNVGMVKLSEDLPSTTLFRYLKSFGFGTETGIGLNGESSGSLKQPEKWSGVSKSSISIGYEIGVTALQMTSAYCAIVNGGYLYKPYIISRRETGVNKWETVGEPEKVRQVISPEVSDILKGFMRNVIDKGTGTAAHLNNVIMGGKTGTAWKYNEATGSYSGKYVGSFVGFAPYDKPRYMCGVFIDEPSNKYYGGVVAAPVFKEIMQQIIYFEPEPPKYKQPSADDDMIYADKVESAPVLTGFGVKDATDFLEDRDFDVDIKGDGDYILGHSKEGDKITLQTGSEKVDLKKMPDLRGLTIREALSRLDLSRFVVRLEGSGKVHRQSVNPGTSVKGRTELLLSCR